MEAVASRSTRPCRALLRERHVAIVTAKAKAACHAIVEVSRDRNTMLFAHRGGTKRPQRRRLARDLAELKSPWARKLTRDPHVNIVAGRATLADRTPRLYASVHKLEPSAPARLDQFLFASGVAPDERVTVISDDAGEFGKAVDGSHLARGRILDWFHIAMKFKAARNSVLGSQTMEPHERIAVETQLVAGFPRRLNFSASRIRTGLDDAGGRIG
jgi:hypothetical protein